MPTPAATDRRGEAHLWLLLEEALADARAAHASGTRGDVDEVLRRFDGVVNALSDVGAVARPLARHIADELEVALTVRGIVEGRSFLWRDPPALQPEDRPVRQRGDGWLEAMIEQQLDVVVDVTPATHIGERVIANLTPQVRALRAVGSLKSSRRLEDLAATLAAAGYAPPPAAGARGEVDKGWLSFLEARPRPLTGEDRPAAAKAITYELGHVDRGAVTLTELAWSTDLLRVELTAPTYVARKRWTASAFDDSGQLHLGQPALDGGGNTGALVFDLRPGLRDTVRTLSLRVTHEATRLDEQVSL